MKMDGLAENILKNMLDKSLTEDMVYELTRACATSIVEEMAISWTDVLKNLESFLDSLWRSKGYRQYDADDVFGLGRVYTAVDMLKMVSEKQELTIKVKEDAGKYAARRRLFEQIAKNPGITHKELARKASISESALSQFYGKIQYDNYILSHKAGRTKYYYLSMTGKQLLAEMQRNMDVDSNDDLNESQLWQRDVVDRLIANALEHDIGIAMPVYGWYKMGEEEQEHWEKIQPMEVFKFKEDSNELSELLPGNYTDGIWNGKQGRRKEENTWKKPKRLKQA